MKIDIMTLFPEMCEFVISSSIIGRAISKGILDIKCHYIRDYTYDKHKRVDDTPYGGGNGMVMKAEPIALCFESICKMRGDVPLLIYMSPKGEVLTQKKAELLSHQKSVAILCGHYEGVDERVIESLVDEQISIGDYVLTGGELPALVLVDTVSRMIKGVLSNDACYKEESHYNGMLEYPQYTKPSVWRGMKVPDVLLSGHHKNIKEWKNKQSFMQTFLCRPDMIDDATNVKIE